jgi:hypothetical protein
VAGDQAGVSGDEEEGRAKENAEKNKRKLISNFFGLNHVESPNLQAKLYYLPSKWDDEDGQQSVQHGNGGGNGEEGHPKPQNNENLLVQGVERKDAEGVVLCQTSTRSMLLKGAGGHLRKHSVHWRSHLSMVVVKRTKRFQVHQRIQDEWSVVGEGPVQQSVRCENLAQQICRVQKLTQGVLPKGGAVREGALEVSPQALSTLLQDCPSIFLIVSQDGAAQVVQHVIQNASLELSPDETRDVEEGCHDGEDERDPLVVSVIDFGVDAFVEEANARVCHFFAHGVRGQFKDGKGPLHPAVGVHDARIDAVHFAVDRVPEVLP